MTREITKQVNNLTTSIKIVGRITEEPHSHISPIKITKLDSKDRVLTVSLY